MSNLYTGVIHSLGNPFGTIACERPKVEMYRPSPPSITRITHRRMLGAL